MPKAFIPSEFQARVLHTLAVLSPTHPDGWVPWKTLGYESSLPLNVLGPACAALVGRKFIERRRDEQDLHPPYQTYMRITAAGRELLGSRPKPRYVVTVLIDDPGTAHNGCVVQAAYDENENPPERATHNRRALTDLDLQGVRRALHLALENLPPSVHARHVPQEPEDQ